jgi:Asp-tRNA(Asn)/Glu-tRNA(Gln) amidotransferase A subunit family amidase
MANILVVANRTAESPELLEALKQRAQQGDATFTLLVPSTPHGVAWAADMHSGGSEAEAHMQNAVERLRSAGLEVADGKVGDPDPAAAVQDLVNFESFDEVVVSTLPGGISKWLKLDLPHRVERITGLPVTHVVASEVKVTSG